MNTKKSGQKSFLAPATFFVAYFLSPVAIGAPVHVTVNLGNNPEHGAGISVGRGSECFVVVPKHVTMFANEATVTDQNGRSATARPYQAADGADAALLKVEPGHTLDCPEDWVDGLTGEAGINDVDFLIARKAMGMQEGISRSRFFVTEVTPTEIQIQPYDETAANELAEGDSGSSLYANNMLVGMIVEVDTATGTGRALKQSQLHALFGNLVLDQSVKSVLINPVYERNSENIYATYAIREYFEKETPLEIAEMHESLVQANLRSVQSGVSPTYPEGIDYVVTANIIQNDGRRKENPNYKPNAKKTSNLGEKLRNSLQNRKVRYLYVSNVDVEVQIFSKEEDRYYTHLEQLEYETALKKNVDERELHNQAPVKASRDAIKAAVEKFNLPVNPKPIENTQSIFGLLFGKKDEAVEEGTKDQ